MMETNEEREAYQQQLAQWDREKFHEIMPPDKMKTRALTCGGRTMNRTDSVVVEELWMGMMQLSLRFNRIEKSIAEIKSILGCGDEK